jgi:hypothetical protein
MYAIFHRAGGCLTLNLHVCEDDITEFEFPGVVDLRVSVKRFLLLIDGASKLTVAW